MSIEQTIVQKTAIAVSNASNDWKHMYSIYLVDTQVSISAGHFMIPEICYQDEAEKASDKTFAFRDAIRRR